MKKVLFSLLLILSSACVQNNGYIGNIFGNWKLENIVYPNGEINEVTGLYMAFQSTTVQMTHVVGMHMYGSTTGNWEKKESILILDFPDLDRPPISEFELPRYCELKIENLTNKRMILVYYSNGKPIIYNFIKW